MKRGFTLLELMVVVAVIGLLSGVSLLAWLREPTGAKTVLLRSLSDARSNAIRSGHPVRWESGRVLIRFFPDGSSSGGAAGDSVWVDPLTGLAHVWR